MKVLLRFRLRRERIALPVWIVVIVGVVLMVGATVLGEFGTAADRQQLIGLGLASPALLVFRGVPDGASTGSVIWYQLFTWTAVLVGLMNTFFATRHGRAEEESGGRELLGAAPLSRSASFASTVLVGLGADLALGLLGALAFVALGLPAGGSALAGAGLTVTGLAFLGVGLLASELAPTGRSANAIGGTVVGAAYALRAAGDALGTPNLAAQTLTPAWSTWASPIGWVEMTLPFTQGSAWLLLPGLALALVTTGCAAALAVRRDLGASILPERLGRATARPGLASLPALGWRLRRTGVVGWTVGAAVLGLAAGPLAKATASALKGDAQVQAIMSTLAGGASGALEWLVAAAVLGVVGMLAVAAGVQAVLREREEETSGRSETLAALPVTRAARLGTTVLLGVVAATVVLVGAGVAALLGFLSQADATSGWRALGQQLASAPVAVLAVAVVGLLLVVLPRIAVAAGSALYGVAVALSLFGGMLKLPDWLVHLSPFTGVPGVPVSDWTSTLLIAAVAVVALVAAFAANRRRELVA